MIVTLAKSLDGVSRMAEDTDVHISRSDVLGD